MGGVTTYQKYPLRRSSCFQQHRRKFGFRLKHFLVEKLLKLTERDEVVCDTKGAVTLCHFSCNLSRTPLRDKLHESLPNVTYLTTAKNVARPFAETVVESRIEFYFPQRLQGILEALPSETSVQQLVWQRFAAPANENVLLISCDH